MTRMSARIVVLTLVLAALTALPAAAQAPKAFKNVTGNYALELLPDAPFTIYDRSKNVCIFHLGIRLALTGDLEGPFDFIITLNQKGPCSAWSAAANLHGKGAFLGTLGGKVSGTVDGSMIAWHELDDTAHGQIVLQNGAAGFAGLRGVISFTGIVGVGGTYSGELHFEP